MKEFDKYTANFDKKNQLIYLKYNHSYRVSNVSKKLAINLNLSKSEITLAENIGLLHDIGRFEQIKIYNSLNDNETVDHADFGAKLLFEKGLISKFNLDKSDYNTIEVCVKGHNKYCMENNLDRKIKTQLKIIRDSDKIDILNIVSNLDELDMNYYGEISKDVEELFYYNKLIINTLKKHDGDKIVGFLSYIFDINFKESLEYIAKERFIENFYERIEEKEKFKPYFDYIQNYIKEKIS